MNDLCKQAVETGKLTLTSNVLQQRDFIPMNDVCSVVERFIFHKNFEEKNNILTLDQVHQVLCLILQNSSEPL